MKVKKVKYMGFDIEIIRETESNGAKILSYILIHPDGHKIEEGYDDSRKTDQDMIEDLKEAVDEYMEREEDGEFEEDYDDELEDYEW